MNDIRFALIGTGAIADFHARAIAATPGARLVAVHSRTPETGRAFAVATGSEYEANLGKLLARDDIDVVAITTPSGTHAEIGIAAARKGKHILCEKPLDVTVEKIDELLRVVEEENVLLGAIFQSHFGPGARAAKKAVEAGRLGKLAQAGAYIPWFRSKEYYASAGWRGTWALDGGGALMNQGIHAIYLLLWLAGDVAEVSARIQTRLHDIEVEDNAVAWLLFTNGGLGIVQGSTACYPGEPRRIELKGEKGSITLVGDTPVLWEFEEESPEDVQVRALAKPSPENTKTNASDPRAIGTGGHGAHYADFVAAMREGRQPAVNGRDGRKAVQLIRAIYESSERKQIVHLEN